MQGHEFDKWSLCISCGRWYAGSWGKKRTKGAFMPGGLPRNPDIVFGIGQNLTVRWPRIATRKKLKSGASRFHWLGLHLVKRTQRPLAIEQSWQEMQWNKILDWNAKLIFKKFPLPNGWVRRWYYLMIFNVVWGLQMVFDCDGIQCNESPLWNWWLACNWRESPLLNITTGLDSEHVLQKDATDASK